ncbi:MAG: hypothetical protein JWO82_1770, partial [Akkermansiaceae bacterium]|nr:hypothetical protein [Akkermansiaceae bacterium]
MSDQTGGLFYEMNAIYLRRKLKVILAPGHGETSPTALAALQKNLNSLGYVLDLEVCDRLRGYSSEELTNFSAALVTKLQVMVGAHREYRPMYPDFPRHVMALAEAELYWNALIHYLTNRLPSQDARARPALLGGEAPKVIALGSTEDFERIFIQLAGAKSALSEEDRSDLKGIVATYRDDILRLVPGEIPVKENLAVLAAALLESTTYAAAQEWVATRIATATDILRLAVAMSGGDPSLAEAAKFRQFRRPERRLLLSWLERCSAPTEDMLRWKGRWIRLGERLHPGEQAEKYPKAYAAFEVLRNDLPYETFNSKVERCLAAGDAGGAIQYLSSRPGELTRRLDHLLRIATDPDEVVAAFKVAAPKVSTPVVLQAMGHFAHRDEPQDLRTFFPKGNVGKVQAISNELPPLAAGLAGVVLAICEDALVERFAKLPPLGRCYIDPALKDFAVPFSQRSASKSLRALARGSRIPME